MKVHKGMRPHDIPILLKIIALGDKPWMNKDLAASLQISASEISDSISRSVYAGLIGADRRSVHLKEVEGFIRHGLKYVFPIKPGAILTGKGTAHSAPTLRLDNLPLEHYVWPDPEGRQKGMLIMPLFPGAVYASGKDHKLYEMLALCDVMRLGTSKEMDVAARVLNNLICNK